jgi:aromatic ring hydroxylase
LSHAGGTAAFPESSSGAGYRESLRRYTPKVYVDGELIASVADAPTLQPGINALAVSYDFALDADKAPLMTAVQTSSGGLSIACCTSTNLQATC